MASVRAKVFEYSIGLDPAGAFRIDDTAMPKLTDTWTPEHLVLAGLVRCSLTSLGYHARREGITLAASSGSASGRITKRAEDGRYAFVEIDCELDVTLEPAPDDMEELLAKGERDCFIGASLTVKPRYRWRVNGAVHSSGAIVSP